LDIEYCDKKAIIDNYDKTQHTYERSLYYDYLKGVKENLRYNGYDNIPILFCEYSLLNRHTALGDTCIESCNLVKTQLEIGNLAHGSGYWFTTYINAENMFDDKVFNGNIGIFTINNIKKPSFYAYEFLSKLKRNILNEGAEYIITSDNNDEIFILLYNFYPYHEDMSHNIKDINSYDDYFSVLMDKSTQSFEISLNVKDRQYCVQHRFVNRNNGSVYDEFMAINCSEPLSKEEIEYLSSRAIPGIKKQILYATNGQLTFTVNLEPYEIRLLTISKLI
jgi:xylan 1,4-beta-xylosidase